MNDIVREFLVESHESLAQLDRDLVTLEREPGDRETLARVFRTVHTVKGTAGFLGLANLEAVSHAGESLLSRVRAGALAFDPGIANALLGTVDAIRQMLATLEASAGTSEGEGDYSAAIEAVERLTALPPRDTNGSEPPRRLNSLRRQANHPPLRRLPHPCRAHRKWPSPARRRCPTRTCGSM